MNRTLLTTSIVLFIASSAFAQSDDEILETLRTSITETYLEELSNDLPKSFLNSGLSPSDKERLVQQLAVSPLFATGAWRLSTCWGCSRPETRRKPSWRAIRGWNLTTFAPA